MPESVPVTALLQAFIAVVTGGTINLIVLAWLVFSLFKIDKRLATVDIHMGYMRRDLTYLMGREWEPDPDSDRSGNAYRLKERIQP